MRLTCNLVCEYGDGDLEHELFAYAKDAEKTLKECILDWENVETGAEKCNDIDDRTVDECVKEWGYCGKGPDGDKFWIEETEVQ